MSCNSTFSHKRSQRLAKQKCGLVDRLPFVIADLAERLKATKTETSANPWSEREKRKAVATSNEGSQ